jgi:hypothetical protein
MSRIAEIARYAAILLGLCAAASLLVAFGARFVDGPISVFPGGPFASGTATDYGDVFKRWPRELELDDRVILRLDGMRVLGPTPTRQNLQCR